MRTSRFSFYCATLILLSNPLSAELNSISDQEMHTISARGFEGSLQDLRNSSTFKHLSSGNQQFITDNYAQLKAMNANNRENLLISRGLSRRSVQLLSGTGGEQHNGASERFEGAHSEGGPGHR